MLERGKVLRTWRLAQAPTDMLEPIAATPLPDHRLFYLSYEGPVSGDRGVVSGWDSGTYRLVSEAMDGTKIVVELDGNRLSGVAALEQTDSGEWTLSWDG